MTDLHTDIDRIHQPLRAGELVAARYRLENVAGAGGMATVWRAYDERLQRPVAIKVISDALATNPGAVARFAREARTHARIQHPNLVQVYDYSVTASQPYLVMEYINGCTLSERLDRGDFSDAEIHALAAELLSAIACVHSHGVLHRDVKTGNVLLDRDGHARLTDFGLARLEDSTQITRSNEVVGTLRFLAPELIEGQPASRQSDLYALGVLLRTVAADENAPPELQSLITWMTQHDPNQRPSDAHAVLTALRGGRPHDALKPPTMKPRPVKTQERETSPALTKARKTPAAQARRSRYSTNRDLRSRTVAVSALLVAVAGITLAIITAAGGTTSAGSSGSARAAANRAGHGRVADVAYGHSRPAGHAPTIAQQLEQLAGDVRSAAKR